jgi:hypothetical protein
LKHLVTLKSGNSIGQKKPEPLTGGLAIRQAVTRWASPFMIFSVNSDSKQTIFRQNLC